MNGIGRIMWMVCAAMLPGLGVLTYYYGLGYLWNLLLAWPIACGLDMAAAWLRGQRLRANETSATSLCKLGDGSMTVTALILALSLPPAAPWHVIAVASAAAALLARQLYGGLGRNIFNPAMVGYALVLVSYPLAMSAWPPPTEAGLDGTTGATALTAFKYRDGLTVAEVFSRSPAFGHLGDQGWEWANLAFAVAGLWLWRLGLIAWRVVCAFLVTLGALALIFNDGGSSLSAGPPLFHLFAGGTLLAAFFVITDPVTHPGTRAGQWLFGGITAAITFVIRAWGGYPDGIAFAVLIANAATPLIDHIFRRQRREVDDSAPA